MSYIAIINNEVLSCSTRRLVLSQSEVSELTTIEELTNEILKLKSSEENRVSQSITDGYQSGYLEGLNQGLTDLNEQFREYLKDLTENIYISNIESDEVIMNLSVQVIKKIASEIGNEEMIRSIALTAIQRLKHSSHLEVRVNSKYADLLKQNLEAISESASYAFSSLEVIADAGLDDLDCIIKTESGTTIASFEEQLNILRDQFKRKKKAAAETNE